MTYDITASFDAIESYIAASGYYQHVQRGEPKTAPGPGLTAAVGMREVAIAETTLVSTIEVHTVEVLVYWNELSEPDTGGESEMARAIEMTLKDLLGDYSLGGAIRAIDVAGMHSSGVSVAWGYNEISGVWYRMARITLPLIVDDSVTTSP